MIHTNIPWSCMVFLLLRELKWSAFFCWVKNQMADRACANSAISRLICVDHYILLCKNLSNYIDFIKKNGFKIFHRPSRPIQGSVTWSVADILFYFSWPYRLKTLHLYGVKGLRNLGVLKQQYPCLQFGWDS